ncbi:MAG TPA: protein translocase subunit SecD, partial [Sphingomicrobium sp.]
MLDFPRWKVWLVSLTILVGILLAIPSLLPKDQVERWPAWLPSARINLGLDIAGGSQLLLEADLADAAKTRLQAKEDEVTTELRRNEPRIDIGDVSTAGGRLSFVVRDPTQLDAAFERMRTLSQPQGLTGTRDWEVSTVDGNRIVLTPTEAGANQALTDSLTVARDVVRRRIDPGGTKEITVINQGQRRIFVQVPGVEDPEALKQLIGQTARLEFKLVDMEADPSLVAQGRAPPGSQVLEYPDAPPGIPYVAYPQREGDVARIAVKRRVMVSGEQLVNATQSFDQQNGNPVVDLSFNTAGARRFGRVT